MSREPTLKHDSSAQQASASSAGQHNDATTVASQRGDRERSISTGREEGGRDSSGKGVSRHARTSPASDAGAHPLMLLQRMAQDMDRLFEQFGFGRPGFSLTPGMARLFDEGSSGGRSSLIGTQQTLWSPQVELVRRGDKLVVQADLPGVKKDDLKIEVQDDVLTLSGERREEHEEDGDGYYHSERSYGRFYRAIPLPEGVNADQVDATFANGVLEVAFAAPRREEHEAKRIEIR
jgi:HSP20 family protein